MSQEYVLEEEYVDEKLYLVARNHLDRPTWCSKCFKGCEHRSLASAYKWLKSTLLAAINLRQWPFHHTASNEITSKAFFRSRVPVALMSSYGYTTVYNVHDVF